jgi:hypothetical protein
MRARFTGLSVALVATVAAFGAAPAHASGKLPKAFVKASQCPPEAEHCAGDLMFPPTFRLRPRRIELAFGGSQTLRLRWSTWTTRKAEGRGVEIQKGTDGKTFKTRVSVVLKRPRRVRGSGPARVFTRLVLTETKHPEQRPIRFKYGFDEFEIPGYQSAS